MPGGTTAAAAALGIERAPDRARFVPELVRLAYGLDRRPAVMASFVERLRASLSAPDGGEPEELVPLPLTARVWSDAVFHRRIAPRAILAAILADRQAALL